VMAMQLVGANSERLHRASHRLVGEPSRLTDAFAEPDDARECIDDAEAATGGACNEQPAVVGAEIEGPVDRVIATSRLPGWWRSGVPLPSAKWLPTRDWKGLALRADLGPLIAIVVIQKSSLGRRRCFKVGVVGLDRPLDVTRSVRT